MATPTYTAIASITLGSSAASVTFSSIDQSYRDLVLVVTGKNTGAARDLQITINSDTNSANYSKVLASGDGSSTYSVTTSGQVLTYYGSFADSAETIITLNLMDYSATDKHKTILTRASRANSGVDMTATRYASTSAITSIEFFMSSLSFDTGCTFSLWGIAS